MWPADHGDQVLRLGKLWHLACTYLYILIVLMCCMTYFYTAMHFMVVSVATKVNFLGLESILLSKFKVYCIYFASLCWLILCSAWPIATLQCTSWSCPWPLRSLSWLWSAAGLSKMVLQSFHAFNFIKKCLFLCPKHVFWFKNTQKEFFKNGLLR